MNKYHNKPTLVDNIRFASIAESCRYKELVWMQNAGRIKDLELQPRFDLVVNGHKVGAYIGDFRYFDIAKGEYITEDAKGVRTAIYSLKKKLMKAPYNIDIVEV